jgi:hypothetical protein
LRHAATLTNFLALKNLKNRGKLGMHPTNTPLLAVNLSAEPTSQLKRRSD